MPVGWFPVALMEYSMKYHIQTDMSEALPNKSVAAVGLAKLAMCLIYKVVSPQTYLAKLAA
jgi:hypothetical protein